MDLNSAMQQATKELGGDPIAINRGELGDYEEIKSHYWAEKVCYLFPDAKLHVFIYKEESDCYYYHNCVYYKGRFYDSETPEGVNETRLFPIFKRIN